MSSSGKKAASTTWSCRRWNLGLRRRAASSGSRPKPRAPNHLAAHHRLKPAPARLPILI